MFVSMIERASKHSVLEKLKWSPVVAIIGPRQSGKTTLVKDLFSALSRRSVYLDLELPSDIQKLHDPESFLRHYADTCVILDEIHRMPELFPVLRALVDSKRTPARFILIDSSSLHLSKSISESLAGCISNVELMPFHFSEVSGFTNMKKHWFRGGFPCSLLASSDAESQSWLDDFLKTYIERDLPLLGLQIDRVALRRFLSMLAHSQGQIWNASLYAGSLGISEPTVRTYLDFFERTFIAHRLQPFIVKLKKRLVKAPKTYLRDSGILHRLLRIPDLDTLIGHPGIGASFEGYVVEQVLERLPDELSLYYYRTHQGSGCDLVFVKGHIPVATAEIKYSAVPSITRGYTTALADLGVKENYLLLPHSDTYRIRETIHVYGIANFLEEILPKLGEL